MLRFNQYLSEIFSTAKKHSVQGSHPDLRRDNEEMVEYHFTPTDKEGKPMHSRAIKTTFLSAGPKDRWEVMFKVGGVHSNDPSHEFPSDVTKRVFDHISHFVQTKREVIGNSPTLIYDTQHPKKHRIYQTGAKRLGIRAENMAPLDPELDRGGNKKKQQMYYDEPEIGGER